MHLALSIFLINKPNWSHEGKLCDLRNQFIPYPANQIHFHLKVSFQMSRESFCDSGHNMAAAKINIVTWKNRQTGRTMFTVGLNNRVKCTNLITFTKYDTCTVCAFNNQLPRVSYILHVHTSLNNQDILRVACMIHVTCNKNIQVLYMTDRDRMRL